MASEEQPVQTLTKSAYLELLLKQFDKLPDNDRNLFTYGPMYLGGNAALAGLLANSFWRRALNVRQGHIVSSLPMATLPFLTTAVLYNAAVSNPLLMGDINCPTCVVTRGFLVGLIGGGVYPLFLALPVSAGLAARYSTAPMPEKGNIIRHWIAVSRPIVKRMAFVFVLQGFFGAYLSSRHFDIYLKLLKSVDIRLEDLHD
ncbi:transmembrane protein 126A [Engraulis encrasicolus]|uniref:transmembrane protein 126A n=1 Tax=Engraulis encrasicolus TaxID=184585 RepID=UPI002FD1C0B7